MKHNVLDGHCQDINTCIMYDELSTTASGRFVRLNEIDRPQINFSVNGESATALSGDSLLVAMMLQFQRLRTSEFDGGARAGFCLMGACQDCWVWTETGERLRACTTVVEDGMRICTEIPEGSWPNHE